MTVGANNVLFFALGPLLSLKCLGPARETDGDVVLRVWVGSIVFFGIVDIGDNVLRIHGVGMGRALLR